jgi:hypothetical protein
MQAQTAFLRERHPSPGSAPHGSVFDAAPGAPRTGTTVTLRHFMDLKHGAELRHVAIPRVLGIRFFEGGIDDPRRVLVDIDNAGAATVPGHPACQ